MRLPEAEEEERLVRIQWQHVNFVPSEAGTPEEEESEQPLNPNSKGLRRSILTSSTTSLPDPRLMVARPSSAPPVELQRLSRATASGAEPEPALGLDDPRGDPGYALYFHANRRMDPRLPPPVYAPGQSWQQIWTAPSFGPVSEISIRTTGLNRIDEEQQQRHAFPDDAAEEFEALQQQIASSSAGGSSSSTSSPTHLSTSHQQQRKRLVDMIQEDFPRTPSPVYGRGSFPRAEQLTGQTSRTFRSTAATAGSSTDFLGFSLESLSLNHGEEESEDVQLPGMQRVKSMASMSGSRPAGLRFGAKPAGMMGPPPPSNMMAPLRHMSHVPSTSGARSASANIPFNQQFDLVEEIKAGGRQRRIEMSELAGHFVRLSVDQHGSRFIQQRLESLSPNERAVLFAELLPHALGLMTDVFGNYVIQKFFEHGSPSQQETLCGLIRGHVLELSLQMYGCRVVQKALEHGTASCRRAICAELEDAVLRCVKDQNGNHVIQKCIEAVSADSASFLAAAFSGHVYSLATHPYGCRVIQRFFEHAPSQHVRPLIAELLRYKDALMRDQYGNYVIQHLMERGALADRALIISGIRGSILDLARHKFASNVVEKAVQFGTSADRQALLDEVLAPIPDATCDDDAFALLLMMRDQFANYVVQKMLDLLDSGQKEVLLERIKPHLPALRRFTFGKHIITKVDRLLQEQAQQQSRK